MQYKYNAYNYSNDYMVRMMQNNQMNMEVVRYTVKRGDTLYKISKSNNLTVEELMTANFLDNTMIYPGQILVIPRKGEGAVYFDEYETQDDDTISKIANNNHISVEDLSKYNDMSSVILRDGQMINIPRPMRNYIVKNHDTVTSILAKNNLSSEQLLRANSQNWLKPGTKINL